MTLKNDELLFTKVYNVWAQKSTEKLSFIAPESDAKFEKKMTFGLEKNMSNFSNFYQSTWKSQNWGFHEVLLSKVENARA